MKGKKLTQEDFIKKALSIHGDKYDYNLTVYNKYSQKVKIICPIHGLFEQLPVNHLAGRECQKCGYDKIATDREVYNNNIEIPTNCKLIYLTRGLYSIVDDDEYDRISKHRWSARIASNTNYARGQVEGENMSLHRFILKLTPDNKEVVDHINGNGLDNRKVNLRKCTIAQNSFNQKSNGINKSSPYKGVNLDKKNKKWKAAICVYGKKIYLGHYVNEVDAAKAYDNAAIKHHKEFAKTNF